MVAIKIDQTRAFDTEWNTSSQATGFVVDAERGLILTNRHVVTPGPVTAEATFLNREEVQLYPVYRDPVHDFGLYRYDPSKLRFIKPKALPLYPEGAEIGREIRVVGNNAGVDDFGMGLLLGLDTLVSQAFGRGRPEECHRWLVQGIHLCLVLSPMVMLLLLGGVPWLGRLGVNPAVLAQALPFLKALTWGPPDGPIALCLHGFPDTAYGWRKVAPRLQQLLASLAGHPMVFNIRGVGLGGAVQLHSREGAPGARGQAMQDAMMAEGLLLRVVKDTINFAPPLIITQAEVEELFARFCRALEAVQRSEGAA